MASFGDAQNNARFHEFNKIAQKVATKYGVGVLDSFHMFLACPYCTEFFIHPTANRKESVHYNAEVNIMLAQMTLNHFCNK